MSRMKAEEVLVVKHKTPIRLTPENFQLFTVD